VSISELEPNALDLPVYDTPPPEVLPDHAFHVRVAIGVLQQNESGWSLAASFALAIVCATLELLLFASPSAIFLLPIELLSQPLNPEGRVAVAIAFFGN
jgi:hypothetical protein